jgi:hypothetical protein
VSLDEKLYGYAGNLELTATLFQNPQCECLTSNEEEEDDVPAIADSNMMLVKITLTLKSYDNKPLVSCFSDL